MLIVYETNGKGFLGWIEKYPGAYIRGKTLEEARSKLNSEIKAYSNWLDLNISDYEIKNEIIVNSKLMIEDADSDIILEIEKTDYAFFDDFINECKLALLSGEKLEKLYKNCKHKDVVDKSKERTTFYGNVYSTIQTQYEHVVKVQQYYLGQIGAHADIDMNKGNGRENTIIAIQNQYKQEGNKYYANEDEDWTIRKILRRLIWHDRIHGKAIERMEQKLS